MKFTFWAIGAPLMAFGACSLLAGKDDFGRMMALLSVPFGIWLIGGVCCILPYWIVRLARRSWNDGAAQPPARPSGWIYPDQRP